MPYANCQDDLFCGIKTVESAMLPPSNITTIAHQSTTTSNVGQSPISTTFDLEGMDFIHGDEPVTMSGNSGNSGNGMPLEVKRKLQLIVGRW